MEKYNLKTTPNKSQCAVQNRLACIGRLRSGKIPLALQQRGLNAIETDDKESQGPGPRTCDILLIAANDSSTIRPRPFVKAATIHRQETKRTAPSDEWCIRPAPFQQKGTQ